MCQKSVMCQSNWLWRYAFQIGSITNRTLLAIVRNTVNPREGTRKEMPIGIKLARCAGEVPIGADFRKKGEEKAGHCSVVRK